MQDLLVRLRPCQGRRLLANTARYALCQTTGALDMPGMWRPENRLYGDRHM